MSETKSDLLSIELGDNDSGKATLGGFLAGMIDLETKRPYGNSGWEWDLYAALVRAEKIDGTFNEYGEVENIDHHAAHALIEQAAKEIRGMFR